MKLLFSLFLYSLIQNSNGSYIGEQRTVTEKASTNVHLYNTIEGQTSVGDTLPFYNPLYDGDTKVGTVSGVCTYIDTTTTVWQCQFTLSFDDGDISVLGNIIEDQDCSDQVIVGGTGAYISAEGLDRMCWPKNGSGDYSHNIMLESKVSPVWAFPMVEHAYVQAQVFYSAFGQTSVGDTNPFFNKLYGELNENQVGDLNGVCTYLKVDPIVMQCYVTYVFPVQDYPKGGKVASLGLLRQQEKCAPQAIAGGTGAYLGAQGTVELCWPEGSGGNYTHEIEMTEPSIKPSGEYVVIEKPSTNTHIFNTEYGVVSIGDTVPFRNELYDESDETKIGTLNGVCTYVQINPRAWSCEMVYETATGQVMVSGVFGDANDCQQMPIIGGTSSFSGVDGTVEVCWPKTSDLYKHTLKFDTSTMVTSSAMKNNVMRWMGFLLLGSMFLTL